MEILWPARKVDNELEARRAAAAARRIRAGRRWPSIRKSKSSNLKRLRRIEGQVRGLQRLVDEDRYCADILVQISSVQEALRSVGRALMKNHLRHCASEAIRDTAPGRAEAMYEELLNLMDLHSR